MHPHPNLGRAFGRRQPERVFGRLRGFWRVRWFGMQSRVQPEERRGWPRRAVLRGRLVCPRCHFGRGPRICGLAGAFSILPSRESRAVTAGGTEAAAREELAAMPGMGVGRAANLAVAGPEAGGGVAAIPSVGTALRSILPANKPWFSGVELMLIAVLFVVPLSLSFGGFGGFLFETIVIEILRFDFAPPAKN